MLDFLVMLASYPQEFYMSHSAPDVSGRPKGSEWLLSYSPDQQDRAKARTGCVYAPTQHEVIAEAMRLWTAQEAAERLIAEAQK